MLPNYVAPILRSRRGLHIVLGAILPFLLLILLLILLILSSVGGFPDDIFRTIYLSNRPEDSHEIEVESCSQVPFIFLVGEMPVLIPEGHLFYIIITYIYSFTIVLIVILSH